MIYAGEFNSGIKENVTINARQHSQFIKIFLDFSMYGAAFNLTNVLDNWIRPNENFENLCKAIKSNLKDQ